MSSATRLALLERAGLTPDLARPEKPGRLIPPGFVPLAWACLVLMVAAGVHQRVLEHFNGGARPRTSLHATKVAYPTASWMASP